MSNLEIDKQQLSDIYKTIIDTLNNQDSNWKKRLEDEISQSKTKFEDLNDTDIFKKLSFAIMSAQAKWYTISEHYDQIEDILLGFNIFQVAKLSDNEINEKYKKLRSLDKPRITSRFLEMHLFAIRNNAKKIIKLFPEPGGFKTFIEQFKTDPLNLESQMVYSEKYKMERVGEVIFKEFAKEIGIPSIKPDTHIIRLFHRLGLANSGFEIKDIAEEWAKVVGVELTELDNILWFFCADKYGEICTQNNPKCDKCRLRVKYCQWNKNKGFSVCS